ncbi:MAG: hypothetical protein IJM76_08360 [Lachnospiraceae bacterium]|nr:hypothetical protein [Lachnospiraceae bacterium]
MPWWGWLLIGIAVFLVAAAVVLYILGKRMQKKQAEAEKQMELMKQQVSILVIDKQKKKMTEAGLPEAVLEQAPKYARRMKLPVVKCKIGPRIMTLIADQKVYDILPVKKTCTVTVSGIYITELKSVRGGSVPKIPEKKNFFQKLRDKAMNAVSRK